MNETIQSFMFDLEQKSILQTKRERRTFTTEEDEVITMYVRQYGSPDFYEISKLLHSRTITQIRERYRNFLDPNLNLQPFSEAEDSLLIQKYFEFNGKWCKMAKFFRGRTDIHLRNRHSILKRKAKSNFINYTQIRSQSNSVIQPFNSNQKSMDEVQIFTCLDFSSEADQIVKDSSVCDQKSSEIAGNNFEFFEFPEFSLKDFFDSDDSDDSERQQEFGIFSFGLREKK
jgi:hypothetical protein